MNLYSPWVVPAAVLVALATTGVLARWFAPPPANARYAAIDGLRGFLAFFVFLHHGSIWYVQLRQQVWQVPASRLFVHLGESSVALFFMITAFLFTRKLLDGRERGVDWLRLYTGRVMRLLPLYAVAVAVLLLMAMTLTGWTLQVSPLQLARQVWAWLCFSIPGAPAVNGFPVTWQLIAGVTWSLRYEWWFYLCLPALAALVGARPSAGWLTFAGANVVLFHAGWKLDWERILPFVGGIAAAYAVGHEGLRRWARHPLAHVLVLVCLAATVAGTSTAYWPDAVALLSVAFVLIACGNDVFGALSAPLPRLLGEATYSIYLLHGLLLSALFRWGIGLEKAATLSVLEHWALVLALVVPLIGLSFVTYRWVEVPGQAAGVRLANWLQRRRAAAPVAVGAK